MSKTTCPDCGVYGVAYLGEDDEARYECPECGKTWVETRPPAM